MIRNPTFHNIWVPNTMNHIQIFLCIFLNIVIQIFEHLFDFFWILCKGNTI